MPLFIPLSTITLLTGITGATLLVIGAAWPEPHTQRRPVHPVRSVKNWLFTVGGIFMGLYGFFGWLQGGTAFFMFLEGLVLVASVFMLTGINDRKSVPFLILCAAGFVVWSLLLEQGIHTLFFILGLTGIALGYAFKMGTLRRHTALTLGSILISLFSYLEQDWIFFWLNLFFAAFSGYYAVRALGKKKS